MLQDQLLQPQESPLVRDLLPNLHTSLPSVLCRQSCTRGTLSSVNNECQDESLLQYRVGQNFLLNGDLDLDSSGMGFGPDI
jgi:hypothetical protein